MTILLTSFEVWKETQPSNSSDDLLAEVQRCGALTDLTEDCVILRRVPVDFEQAPRLVLSQIQAVQPRLIICCGMAEQRSRLSIESQGTWQGHSLQTSINLDSLVAQLMQTTISHDAGSFVCNYLYYAVLHYLAESQSTAQGIFVHIPILTPMNQAIIVEDFVKILRSL